MMRCCLLTTCLCLIAAVSAAEPEKFARFRVGETTAYGLVEGQSIRLLQGDLFGEWLKTDKTYPLKDVTLLVPTEPSQVLAMAGNYENHISDGSITTIITTTTTVVTDPETKATKTSVVTEEELRVSGQVPEKFRTPQPFFKSPSSLVAHDSDVVLPPGAETVHYEAELVVVIGKTAKNVSRQEALDYVFGVTCGNDISERKWQKGDVQWWRAKGSDTFGPCGPYIVRGLNYDNLELTLRLNGETRQEDNTSYLIHDVASTVSFISQFITLHPGDLIFTGTPGKTDVVRAGDVVEVELQGVGVLRNRVVAE